MNLDRESISKLLLLSDAEFEKVLREIAKEAGIDAENLVINKSDITKIRTFLSFAGDDDIARLLGQFGGKNNGTGR